MLALLVSAALAQEDTSTTIEIVQQVSGTYTEECGIGDAVTATATTTAYEGDLPSNAPFGWTYTVGFFSVDITIHTTDLKGSKVSGTCTLGGPDEFCTAYEANEEIALIAGCVLDYKVEGMITGDNWPAPLTTGAFVAILIVIILVVVGIPVGYMLYKKYGSKGAATQPSSNP